MQARSQGEWIQFKALIKTSWFFLGNLRFLIFSEKFLGFLTFFCFLFFFFFFFWGNFRFLSFLRAFLSSWFFPQGPDVFRLPDFFLRILGFLIFSEQFLEFLIFFGLFFGFLNFLKCFWASWFFPYSAIFVFRGILFFIFRKMFVFVIEVFQQCSRFLFTVKFHREGIFHLKIFQFKCTKRPNELFLTYAPDLLDLSISRAILIRHH